MDKPYVFISYAHKDSDMVLPAIEQLQAQGVCLWYDSGIEAGSEWPEFVAEKVLKCEKFVLFISKAYLQSQNCKRELNFAISRKKEILSVFLEDVELSPGMEMQLGTYQALFRKRFSDARRFYASMAAEPFFHSCRTVAQEVPPAAETKTFVQEEKKTADTFQQMHTPYTEDQTLPKKNKALAAVLAFFLGGLGIHKFYLGQKKWGIVYLVLCWTHVPTFVGVVEGIIILMQSEEKFTKKYKCRLK